jgi:hypothetical protein
MGCQMVYFHTKITNLGKFWRDFEWKMLVKFMTVWNSLRPFGILWPLRILSGHLVKYFPFWCFSPRIIWQPCDGFISRGGAISVKQSLDRDCSCVGAWRLFYFRRFFFDEKNSRRFEKS